MLTRRITIRASLATTATLLAIAAPANAGRVQDVRSHDAFGPDLTFSLAGTTSASKADHATPADASVALSQERYYSSYGTPDRAPAPPVGASALAPGGFNWDDAAIGAGGAFAIMILGGAGALRHSREGRNKARAVVS